MSAKSLMCVQKKLHKPMKDRMVLMSVGRLASLIAFSLFFPGFIPFGVSVNPRFFLVSEYTFLQIYFEVILVQSCQDLIQNLQVFFMHVCVY